jgi:hypothetical protein
MPNRKFGTANQFGTSNKFGASSGIENTFTFGLMIDWDGDGIFNGENEATGRITSYQFSRGREFFLNSEGNGFQDVDTGQLTVTLLDREGRYNPYNTSSPLYGLLSGKPRLKLIVREESTGTISSRFMGYVEDVKYKYGNAPYAIITAKDGVDKLKNINVKSSGVTESMQYDNAIAANLSMAGWADSINIDTTASDIMSYYWTRGRSAFTEISELVNAARGLFFIDVDGVATYLSASSSETPTITLDEDDYNYDYGVRIPSPREVVRNKIRIYARSRQSQAGVEIWRAVDKPAITTAASITMWADFSYNDDGVPATSVTTPVATTDYTVFANADGTGTDYTANVTVTMTTFATTAKLVFTLSAGSGYITLAKLRGTVISFDKYTFAEDEDTTSEGVFGIREMVVQSDWLQDLNAATDQAYILKIQLSNPRQFPRVMLKGNPSKQFALDIFDTVNIDFPTYQISDEQRVGYISESWSIQSPNTVETEFYMEPNLAGSGSGTWIFTAIFGLSTVF